MSVLDRLLNRGSPEDEERLDSRVRALLEPLAPIEDHAARVAALPAYIARQQQMATELLRELNLDQRQIADPEMLDLVWDHFLSTRKAVARRRKPRASKSMSGKYRYDLKTLDLIEKIAALFAVSLQASLPEVTWTVGHDPKGKYILEGRPVLSGFPGMIPEMNPAQTVINVANRAMDSDKRGVLKEVFQRWLRPAARAVEDDDDDT